MIINIRGTSGCGKSHLVRHIMSLYEHKEAVRVAKRKQPLFYLCTNGTGPVLAVLGHYETACGGCDTIPSLDQVYALVREHNAAGRNVLFEGLLLTNEVNRTKDLPDCRVIFLNEPLKVCLDSVNGRRAERAKAKGITLGPVNPANTEAKWNQAKRAFERFGELPGKPVQTFQCLRQEAGDLIEEMLGLA